MSSIFCINKSGKKYNVYDDTDSKNRIGSIGVNEAFGWFRDWGGDYVFNRIIFNDGYGNLKWGFLNEVSMYALTGCDEYPYGTVTIDGYKYITFKFRRTEEVRYADGTYWGTVYKGARIACKSSFAQLSEPYWKGVNYVEKPSTGEWVKVTGKGYDYGFVNTGLKTGAMPNTISMYGSWG